MTIAFCGREIGMKKKDKGVRQRKTVVGNTVSDLTAQINVKILKYGKVSLAPEGTAETLDLLRAAQGGIASALGEIRAALAEVRPAESFGAVEADLQELSRKVREALDNRPLRAASNPERPRPGTS